MTFHHATKIVQLTGQNVRHIVSDFLFKSLAHFDNSRWLIAAIQLWTVITD